MMPYDVRPLSPWTGPITKGRTYSPFSATWTNTLVMLDREIRALGARRWVMQIDVSERWIRRDGQLYERAQPASPAVKVAFESRHGPLTYQADRFSHWQDNIRAIALSLEALRKVDRYGVAGHGEQYRGWVAIEATAAKMTREQAAEFLATWAHPDDTARRSAAAAAILDGAAPADALTYAYRLAARRAHPDMPGGDHDTMARLNTARDLLLNGSRP